MSTGATVPVAEPATGLQATTPLFTIERVVVLATPLFAAAAAWLSGLVASNIPWAPPISPTGLAGVMIAMVLGVCAAVIKWLHGRQIPEVAKLSPIKVTQHTLDTLYGEIEAYLTSNAATFQGPKGEAGLTTADIEQLVSNYVGNINETTVQKWVAAEVTRRFNAAAGGSPSSLATGTDALAT
jgi:hypothetical protein